MIVGYILLAVAGALGSAALLWSHSVVEAILLAPLVGSLTVTIAGGIVLVRGRAGHGTRRPNGIRARLAAIRRAAAHG